MCRLELRATVGLCGLGKLKRSSSGTSLHSVVNLRIHAKATSISRRRSCSLSTASLLFYLLCWSLSSLSWNPQAGIYNRLSIKSDANRVYGWSSHNCITPTAKGSAWDNSFHKAYECSPCSLLCFPTHQRVVMANNCDGSLLLALLALDTSPQHEEAEAVLGLSRSTTSFRYRLYTSCLCFQSRASRNQRHREITRRFESTVLEHASVSR